MKKSLFFLAFLLPLAFAFTSIPDDCASCAEPTGVTKTNETISTISFSWDDMAGVDSYTLKYIREGDSATSGDISVNSTSYTYTGLTSGTYHFYFTSNCGGTTSTAFIVINDINGF